MQEEYIKLNDLYVYKLALELGDLGWEIYEPLHWQMKKIMGDQFIESTDSVGANIAEGYGRYHYLDCIKFYYNSRASLLEAKHWIYTMYKRQKTDAETFNKFMRLSDKLHITLNKFISSQYKQKKNA